MKKKIIFIINPRSGVSKKKNLPPVIEKTIDANKFDYEIIFTGYGGHATEIAKDAIKKGIDIIAVAGGDGSLNEVARVLLNSPVILAAIPMGSGNGLARHLKIPVDAVKAIKLINAGKADKIDVGRINDKIFISNTGLGFVSRVVDTFHGAVRRGFFAYSNHTLKNFLGYKSKNYSLKVDGQQFEGKFFMLNFANSNQFGYQAKIAPKADVKDGKLDVVMVKRSRDDEDHRVVRLHLTESGAERLETLSALHLEELERLDLPMPGAWDGLAPTQRTHGFPGPPAVGATQPESTKVCIARVYDEIDKDPMKRVLVDRLWPRGLARSEAPFETWAKDVAPSPALRKWYGHVAGRFEEFDRRYRKELATGPSREALAALRRRAGGAGVILLTAAKDLEHSAAAVLQTVMVGD